MTTTHKPITRETLSSVRDRGQLRAIVVSLHATHATLRLKGCRYSYSVTYDQLWRVGAQNEAEEKRRATREQAKARKDGKR